MRTACWSFAVVAVVCVGRPAAAQVPISEADALARLSPSSPRVRAIQAGVELADAEAGAVGRWPNPRVTVNREAVAGVAEVLSSVMQPLPITGRRVFDRQAAQQGAAAAKARADEERRLLRAEVRAAFADLVSAQARLRELTGFRAQLAELIAMLTRREAAGDSAGYDRLRAEREAFEIDADLSAAASDRARAQGQLARYFEPGTDPAGIVAQEPAALTASDPPSVDELAARAEEARGDVAALGFEREAATLSARAADRRRIPEPELLAGTKTSTLDGGDVGSIVAVQATVPIFDRGRVDRRIADAQLARADARLAQLRTLIRADVSAWRSQLIDRRLVANQYRAGALAIAVEVERIARVSYDAGERGILELLDAYRTAAAARVRQVLLDVAARRAAIELEYASGWEIR